MRESSTGPKADTFPKDGENIRSSKLSEDLVQETRRKEEGSGRLKTVAVAHGGVRCSEDQGAVDHGKGGKPGERQERKKGGEGSSNFWSNTTTDGDNFLNLD